jgi:uncharacterized membrane protein YdbT with pleckstrin-like domain
MKDWCFVSYVRYNLIDSETVSADAKIHWMIFAPSIITFIFGAIFCFTRDDALAPLANFMLIFLGPVLLIDELVKRNTTEMAVTNKRLIAKTGWIARKTIELNLPKVESMTVDQTIFGRMFDYGTIVIHGTGGGKSPYKFIAQPLLFRKEVNKQVEATNGLKG